MGHKPSNRKHSAIDFGEINLVPIMSIITLLIPLLIYAFTFYSVRVVSVDAPRLAKSNLKPPDEDQKKPLNLTVIISDKGYLVKMEPSLVDNAEFRIEKRSFQSSQGDSYEDYDFPALYTKLVGLKEKFPKEATINVGAEFGITWKAIARTIDAARTRLTKDAYEELVDYGTAEAKLDKDKKPTDLFPNVVFVVVD